MRNREESDEKRGGSIKKRKKVEEKGEEGCRDVREGSGRMRKIEEEVGKGRQRMGREGR